MLVPSMAESKKEKVKFPVLQHLIYIIFILCYIVKLCKECHTNLQIRLAVEL